TPIIHAAMAGHLKIVQYLHKNGANINPDYGGRRATPINNAAMGGHLEVVQYLHKNGAN
ncbi:hypothetical protein GQ53DRAFT_589492, partial [Thozetella sp. PMI_491]